MLKIHKCKRYRTARYPRGNYKPKTPGAAEDLIKRAGVPLLLLALIENLGCDIFDGGGGVTGPPPVRPDMVTENEARQIITQVFANNSITLEENYRLAFQPNETDSTILFVDGYNESFRVGYDYIISLDDTSYTAPVRGALADSSEADGPYIKIVDGIIDTDANRQHLKLEFEAFIDTLKAHGII